MMLAGLVAPAGGAAGASSSGNGLGQAAEIGAALLAPALAGGEMSSTAMTVFGGDVGSSGNPMQLGEDEALEDDFSDDDGVLDLESMLFLDSSELDPEVRKIALLS